MSESKQRYKPVSAQVEFSEKAAALKAANDALRGPPRLLSKREVLDRVGLTYPTLWAWMRAGNFPRSRELGGRVAWLESEIEVWMNALPIRRLKGDAPAEMASMIQKRKHRAERVEA